MVQRAVNFSLLVIIAILPAIGQETGREKGSSVPEKSASASLMEGMTLEEGTDPIPDGELSFPEHSGAWRRKLLPGSAEPEIVSEYRILSRFLSRGYTATSDSSVHGTPQQRRAAIITTPGLFFRLRLPADAFGERNGFGWSLVLDFAMPRAARKTSFLSSSYELSAPINRMEIWVDGIFHREIITGYGAEPESPLVLSLPYVRDSEGYVRVELKMTNHPGMEFVLYDAALVRTEGLSAAGMSSRLFPRDTDMRGTRRDQPDQGAKKP